MVVPRFHSAVLSHFLEPGTTRAFQLEQLSSTWKQIKSDAAEVANYVTFVAFCRVLSCVLGDSCYIVNNRLLQSSPDRENNVIGFSLPTVGLDSSLRPPVVSVIDYLTLFRLICLKFLNNSDRWPSFRIMIVPRWKRPVLFLATFVIFAVAIVAIVLIIVVAFIVDVIALVVVLADVVVVIFVAIAIVVVVAVIIVVVVVDVAIVVVAAVVVVKTDWFFVSTKLPSSFGSELLMLLLLPFELITSASNYGPEKRNRGEKPFVGLGTNIIPRFKTLGLAG